jgi:putative hydrolase of the HAD superfamily
LKAAVTTLIFDWGDTVMIDHGFPGPMSEWKKVDWVPGVEEALSILTREFSCIIATSAPHSGRKEMMEALTRVGADKYFKGFYAANEMGVRKPDPGFFRAILLDLDCKPERSISIGNIYEKDITGARDAGMKTILYNNAGQHGPFPKADTVIRSMEDLVGAVRALK